MNKSWIMAAILLFILISGCINNFNNIGPATFLPTRIDIDGLGYDIDEVYDNKDHAYDKSIRSQRTFYLNVEDDTHGFSKILADIFIWISEDGAKDKFSMYKIGQETSDMNYSEAEGPLICDESKYFFRSSQAYPKLKTYIATFRCGKIIVVIDISSYGATLDEVVKIARIIEGKIQDFPS
jgi:hypothetical protein